MSCCLVINDCNVETFAQAQSEDDDTGPDDVAVTVEAPDGYMEAFFQEVYFHSFYLVIKCLFCPTSD